MKLAFVTLVLVCLLLGSSFFKTTMASSSAIDDGEGFCVSKCSVRCSKTRKTTQYLRNCGIYYHKCNCIPPGYYGNKDRCPYYRDLKNSKGNPKGNPKCP